MFEGKEIDRLIELFGSRRVSLFHACQILDFRLGRRALTERKKPSNQWMMLTSYSNIQPKKDFPEARG